MGKPSSSCPAPMRFIISFGKTTPLRITWPMWELQSRKDSTVRTEPNPPSILFLNEVLDAPSLNRFLDFPICSINPSPTQWIYPFPTSFSTLFLPSLSILFSYPFLLFPLRGNTCNGVYQIMRHSWLRNKWTLPTYEILQNDYLMFQGKNIFKQRKLASSL